MFIDTPAISLQDEANIMAEQISIGNPEASIHLARLIGADQHGVFYPFAEALAARIKEHLGRCAELGNTDPNVTLEDELYLLIKTASIDWDGFPRNGRPGEEA